MFDSTLATTIRQTTTSIYDDTLAYTDYLDVDTEEPQSTYKR